MLPGLQKQKQPLYEFLASTDAFQFLLLYPAEALDEHQQEQTIVCSLFQHKLDENFKYTALSYEWGIPAINRQVVSSNEAGKTHEPSSSLYKKQVTVNGQQLAISHNLFDALLHIRARLTKGKAAVLWVDALCIDQDNVLERGRQVAQIRNIYRSAQEVLCWLGPATPDTLSPDTNSFSRDVMQRSYWHRVWIIQEFVLARSISLMCGERLFSLPDIDALDGPLGTPMPTGFDRLHELRLRWKTNKDAPLSLLDAVQLSGAIASYGLTRSSLRYYESCL